MWSRLGLGVISSESVREEQQLPLLLFRFAISEVHLCELISSRERTHISLSHVRLSVTPVDYSPPGSSVHGISQAEILEWVAISFSWGSSPPEMEPAALALQADSLPLSPLVLVDLSQK